MSPVQLFGALVVFCTTVYVGADIIVLPLDGRFIMDEIGDVPSTFGGGLPYEGLRGMVVAVEPIDGCKPINPPPVWDNRFDKYIALIARNNCTFEEKIRIAQNATYDAVIVHNMHSDNLEPMHAKNPTGISIPSVFISWTKGENLRRRYANENYFVIINNEVPFNIETHLIVPFAVVVGICFFVMVGFMIVKYFKDRRRQRRHRLPASALNKIPTCKFEKGDPYDTCAICLDDYVEGEKLRVLPCNHVYHSKCIDPWLTKNRRVCPICKRKVFAHDETPFADTDDSDSDTDDTTPLVNPTDNSTRGGTFEPQSENPFQRAARSISQQSQITNFVATSDHHSINADNSDDRSSYDGSTECLIKVVNERVHDAEVNVHTPGTSYPERSDHNAHV